LPLRLLVYTGSDVAAKQLERELGDATYGRFTVTMTWAEIVAVPDLREFRPTLARRAEFESTADAAADDGTHVFSGRAFFIRPREAGEGDRPKGGGGGAASRRIRRGFGCLRALLVTRRALSSLSRAASQQPPPPHFV